MLKNKIQNEKEEKERIYKREYLDNFQKIFNNKINKYLEEDLNKMEMGENF